MILIKPLFFIVFISNYFFFLGGGVITTSGSIGAVNIFSSITKVLEKDSEDLFKEICRLVDSMQEKSLPDFMYKFKPVTPEILDCDDDY